MKSYLKLYGPSIDKGIDTLERKLNEIKEHYPYGDVIYHAISMYTGCRYTITTK